MAVPAQLPQTALVRCGAPVNFGDWLAVTLPPEQSLAIELEARRVETDPNAGRIAALLLRQSYRQQEFLQAAVHEIARLELLLMEYEAVSGRGR